MRNGIDYLSSVVEHLDEAVSDVSARDLKYADLHLQVAAEVLAALVPQLSKSAFS
ncbi:hypothetical protein ACFU2J_01305 [Streptomyces sp. NPDC057387]|uniref:hypothetical protein n=1 Tax=Streptomyces sp. NPDC057387 TaxID=3346115 RepID=UPI00363A25FF